MKMGRSVKGGRMLAAEVVAVVGVLSFAFLIFAIQQQAEDRHVERQTMAFVLRLSQRYRERYGNLSIGPVAALGDFDDHIFEDEDFGAGARISANKPGPRSSQRQEPKIGPLQTAKHARKRAA